MTRLQAPGDGPGTNTGHGHVWPRPDGYRMRCGGPAMCAVCREDAEAFPPPKGYASHPAIDATAISLRRGRLVAEAEAWISGRPADALDVDLITRLAAEITGPKVETLAVMPPTVEGTLKMWDDLSNAIDRVVTALPGQMSGASNNLEAQRLRFRAQMHRLGMGR